MRGAVTEMTGNNTSQGAAAVEQGEVIRVVVQHCREMKRQETCSRWITALLALTIFAGFLLLQVSTHGTKDDSGQQPMTDTGLVQAQKSREHGCKPRRGKFIHLQSALSSDQTVNTQDLLAVRWITQQTDSKFRLVENDTGVVVPSEGLYLLSLRMPFRVPGDTCGCAENVCFLTVSVVQYNKDYPVPRNVIVGQETMQCTQGWRQTVILNRVISLKNATTLKVTIHNNNRNLVSWDKNNHFEVTCL